MYRIIFIVYENNICICENYIILFKWWYIYLVICIHRTKCEAVSNFNDVNTDMVYEPVSKHKLDISREPCVERFMGFVQMKMFWKHKPDSYECFIQQKLCGFFSNLTIVITKIQFLICEWWFRDCIVNQSLIFMKMKYILVLNKNDKLFLCAILFNRWNV